MLPLRRPGDGLVRAAEERRGLLERALPCARVGADGLLGERPGAGEERADVRRDRLPETRRLVEAPVEGAEEPRDARLGRHVRTGDAPAGARPAVEARVALGAALRGRRLQAVGGTRVVDAVAALGHVAGSRGGAADGRALRVGRTAGAAARAEIGHVALACRWAAGDACGLESVGGTHGARARAGLGDVAWTGGGAALDATRLERISGAGGALSGADLGDVARPGRRPALGGRRLQAIGRAVDAVSAARVRLVARAGRRPARIGDRLEAVGRAGVVHAVAALGRVARASGGTADVRPLVVVRTGGAVAGAELGDVARAGDGPALDARGHELVFGTVGAVAGAELGDV